MSHLAHLGTPLPAPLLLSWGFFMNPPISKLIKSRMGNNRRHRVYYSQKSTQLALKELREYIDSVGVKKWLTYKGRQT